MHIDSDPRMNERLLHALEALLFDKPLAAMAKEVDGIARANSSCLGNEQMCFQYRTERYGLNRYQKGMPPRPINRLQPHLVERFQAFKVTREKLEAEIPYVRGYMQSAMHLATCQYEYLALMPDALAPTVRQHIPDWTNNHVCHDPETIAEFLATNQPYLQKLKQRLALNLLL